MLGKKDCPVKVVSAGCSTGEEPYSLAIGLAEKYGPGIFDSISILGCDMDRYVIQRARFGEYNKYSFRSTTPYFQKKILQTNIK